MEGMVRAREPVSAVINFNPPSLNRRALGRAERDDRVRADRNCNTQDKSARRGRTSASNEYADSP